VVVKMANILFDRLEKISWNGKILYV